MRLEVRGDRQVCDLCGLDIPYRGKAHLHFCKAIDHQLVNTKPQPGDRLERLLTKVGVTQENYTKLKEMAGFEPTCHCPQRKDFLNEMPTALISGFLRGGFAGAFNSGVECAKRIKERYAKPY